MAKQNNSKDRKRANQRRIVPHTLEQYAALPKRSQQAWDMTIQVIGKVRADGSSPYKAARELGIDPRTVLRRAGSVLYKQSNGRYAAKSGDHLLRILTLPDESGIRELAVRGSRQASTAGKYAAAVNRYIKTGDTTKLKKFEGKIIRTSGGEQIKLLTDLQRLELLGSAGELSFESLYAH